MIIITILNLRSVCIILCLVKCDNATNIYFVYDLTASIDKPIRRPYIFKVSRKSLSIYSNTKHRCFLYSK